MAPFLRSDEIEAPSRIDHGGSGTPHHGGGDGDGESGDPYPDHYQNLRRYRLFVFLIFIGVLIFFTALSSAYIIRRGGGHTDWQTGRYIRDWQPLTLPSILWVNTLLLLLSSCTLEIARRNLVRLAAIAPAVSVPGVRRERKLSAPWLGRVDHGDGLRVRVPGESAETKAAFLVVFEIEKRQNLQFAGLRRFLCLRNVEGYNLGGSLYGNRV